MWKTWGVVAADLKPCIKCGGKGLKFKVDPVQKYNCYIQCEGCGSKTRTYPDEREAEVAWELGNFDKTPTNATLNVGETDEYIEREELSKIIFDMRALLKGTGEWMDGYREALEAVEEVVKRFPAAGVMSVVRCRNCKHAIEDDSAKPSLYFCLKRPTIRYGYHYCNEGEEKDNG